MNTEQAKLQEFKEWFDDMWLGDNDHSQFVPLPSDKVYSEYIDKYQISYAAWITAAKVTEENKYQTLVDQIAEIKFLREELETLRAENERLQNNLEAVESDNEKLIAHIELIEAENAKLKDESGSLCQIDDLKLDNEHAGYQISDLKAENAKLIAERNLYKNNCVAYECNCVSCKSTFLGEKEQHICFKCLLAEREAMMKQEPYRYFNESNMSNVTADQWEDSRDLQCYYTLPLYKRPLPAQQIPEVTPEMLRVAQTETELGAIACANFSGGYSLITELFEKMLSASQPKR